MGHKLLFLDENQINVIHMEGWTTKHWQVNCSVGANMTNTRNICKNVQMQLQITNNCM